jgi:hypothetical protein
MISRVAFILAVLLVADAYFSHAKYTRTAMETAQGFGRDFTDQVARQLQSAQSLGASFFYLAGKKKATRVAGRS